MEPVFNLSESPILNEDGEQVYVEGDPIRNLSENLILNEDGHIVYNES